MTRKMLHFSLGFILFNLQMEKTGSLNIRYQLQVQILHILILLRL